MEQVGVLSAVQGPLWGQGNSVPARRAPEAHDWLKFLQGCHRDLKLREYNLAGGRLRVDGVILALKGLHKSVTAEPQPTPFQLVSGGPPSHSAQTSGKK